VYVTRTVEATFRQRLFEYMYDVFWAWLRVDGWGAGRLRRKEGEWGERPSLAITTMFCSEFAYVFRLSLSMRKVAGEHSFCVLIYMNS